MATWDYYTEATTSTDWVITGDSFTNGAYYTFDWKAPTEELYGGWDAPKNEH